MLLKTSRLPLIKTLYTFLLSKTISKRNIIDVSVSCYFKIHIIFMNTFGKNLPKSIIGQMPRMDRHAKRKRVSPTFIYVSTTTTDINNTVFSQTPTLRTRL